MGVVTVRARSTSLDTHERRPASGAGSTRSRFYVGISGVLLLIVLIGFSRTLYLRAFFEVRAIPTSLYFHGAALTAWFVGLMLQTTLVSVGRTDIHRRFGPVGVGIALGVFVSSLLTVMSFPSRQALPGVDEAEIARISKVVGQDLVALLAFATFVAAGIVLRHRREFHKRCMLLASISIVQPALGRLFRLPAFGGILPDQLLSWVTLLILIAAIALYDVTATRRVHPVTLMGGSVFLGFWTVARHVFAGLDFSKAVVRWLT